MTIIEPNHQREANERLVIAEFERPDRVEAEYDATPTLHIIHHGINIVLVAGIIALLIWG